MRISDWSSDVCSSDLLTHCKFGITQPGELLVVQARLRAPLRTPDQHRQAGIARIGADIRNQRPPFRFMARLACNAPRSRIVHADDGDHGANATRRDHGISEGDIAGVGIVRPSSDRSEEHTSELQSLMRISYAVFCLKKKKNKQQN